MSKRICRIYGILLASARSGYGVYPPKVVRIGQVSGQSIGGRSVRFHPYLVKVRVSKAGRHCLFN